MHATGIAPKGAALGPDGAPQRIQSERECLARYYHKARGFMLMMCVCVCVCVCAPTRGAIQTMGIKHTQKCRLSKNPPPTTPSPKKKTTRA